MNASCVPRVPIERNIVEWLPWTGVAMLVISVVGLFCLRDRPVRDRTVVTDRRGRRVRVVQLRAERICAFLRMVRNVPHTGRLLRSGVRMSKRTFYQTIEYMRLHDLIESCVLRDGAFPFTSYRLTKQGLDTGKRD